ncbi:Rec8 like protein-domain-containing protein [Hypoxylon trugodes]|uniref:Rec8 like protein-domain-containing protein n=1 Tax=Hypoxylon trugodes TaxID=326681 RepID=UPI00219DA3EA|nr:Rec8 like protein-domain-containing protein [Hypoxylon trugodes]KAI1391946.1 Rec8 like protein-domain-containing protein [Hypoxylon trugodes]
MFYSHEILTNHQYGVSTIWLIATVGTGTSARRVSKKAIQAVDVEKACGKIIEPGAPVALRLQGQLLYGVSRVYNEQCRYMLSDLQKVQMHMHMLFKRLNGNQLDPDAGKTRPENLLIMNDPDFVPDMQLPQFDLDAILAGSQATQLTNKTSSQMSPLDRSFLSVSDSPAQGFDLRFELGRSESPSQHNSPFGVSSSHKPGSAQHLLLDQDDVFAEPVDWGMEIDEDGNIIERAEPVIVQDEFDLPPLPLMDDEAQGRALPDQQDQPNVDEQGNVIMEDAQPEQAGPVLEQRPRFNQIAFLSDDQQQQNQQAPSRRKRKPRGMKIDERTQISRTEMKGLQDKYLENCGMKKVRPTTAAQAKANAMLLTFGLGLANIGQNIGVPRMVHPLALDFSGDSLFTAFTGLQVPDPSRGKRRSASEAIEDDGEEARRVRPRLEGGVDENQLGHDLENADVFDQDAPAIHSSPEVGREAQAAMSDHLSSALRMPWNRGSSAIPGSSIRGSAQKGRIPSSPLGGRRAGQDAVRFSDDMNFAAGLRSDDDPFDGYEPVDAPAEPPTDEAQKQSGWKPVDIEGHNFFSFMGSAVRENGERRQDDDFDVDRRWVAFEDVFEPRETPRDTAAHAFYNALCLANKGKIELDQDVNPKESFGGIWVGMKMAEIDAPAAGAE